LGGLEKTKGATVGKVRRFRIVNFSYRCEKSAKSDTSKSHIVMNTRKLWRHRSACIGNPLYFLEWRVSKMGRTQKSSATQVEEEKEEDVGTEATNEWERAKGLIWRGTEKEESRTKEENKRAENVMSPPGEKEQHCFGFRRKNRRRKACAKLLGKQGPGGCVNLRH